MTFLYCNDLFIENYCPKRDICDNSSGLRVERAYKVAIDSHMTWCTIIISFHINWTFGKYTIIQLTCQSQRISCNYGKEKNPSGFIQIIIENSWGTKLCQPGNKLLHKSQVHIQISNLVVRILKNSWKCIIWVPGNHVAPSKYILTTWEIYSSSSNLFYSVTKYIIHACTKCIFWFKLFCDRMPHIWQCHL